jgi:hypothetical protein
LVLSIQRQRGLPKPLLRQTRIACGRTQPDTVSSSRKKPTPENSTETHAGSLPLKTNPVFRLIGGGSEAQKKFWPEAYVEKIARKTNSNMPWRKVVDSQPASAE